MSCGRWSTWLCPRIPGGPFSTSGRPAHVACARRTTREMATWPREPERRQLEDALRYLARIERKRKPERRAPERQARVGPPREPRLTTWSALHVVGLVLRRRGRRVARPCRLAAHPSHASGGSRSRRARAGIPFAMPRDAAPLVLVTVFAALAACGGNVVVDPSTGSSSTASGAGASTTGSSGTSAATSSSSSATRRLRRAARRPRPAGP
jgi:hypothetical protein